MSQRAVKMFVTTLLTAAALFVRPAPARADLTAFWGVSPTPVTHQTHGFSIGFNKTLLGGEFEWANTSEKTASAAPGLKTYMFNGLLVTPGRHVQVYVTAGWGRYRETLGTTQDSGFSTNLGGGVKIRVIGPIKLRLDYRQFSLRGSPIVKSPKRFYAGVTFGI